MIPGNSSAYQGGVSPLLSLPNELILHIASYLGTDARAIYRLVCANRRLLWLLTPQLYDALFSNRYIHRADGVLTKAARLGQENIIRLILERGGRGYDMGPLNSFQDPASYVAANAGNAGVIRLMLEYTTGDLLNSKSQVRDSGRTLLLVAAIQGHTEVVKVLLEKGDRAMLLAQSTLERGKRGETALHYAASWGHNELVELLLEQGAMANVKTSDEGITPLQKVAENSGYLMLCEGRDPVPTIKTLLANGADATLVDNSRRTPIHFACLNELHWSSMEKLVEVALEGCKTNRVVAMWQKKTLLRKSHKAVVKLFQENGVDINARDNTGRTALHYAAESRETYMIQTLLGLGADINARTLKGETAVWLAANKFKAIERMRLSETWSCWRMMPKPTWKVLRAVQLLTWTSLNSGNRSWSAPPRDGL